MYDVPKCYGDHETLLFEKLHGLGIRKDEARDAARLMMRVELGFELLHGLPHPVQGEPVSVLWVFLSGMQVQHPTLELFDAAHHRAIANARILLSSYAGRFGWEAALRDYALRLPEAARRLRQYRVEPDNLIGQRVSHSRADYHSPARTAALRDTLQTQLLVKRRTRREVEANTAYRFKPDGQEQMITVRFDEKEAMMAKERSVWFEASQPRPRQPISVTLEQLFEVANWLDAQTDDDRWTRNLSQIWWLTTDDLETRATTLRICGFQHYVGMVSSGKSTLMKLWAAWVVYQQRVLNSADQPAQRITLVVGDTATAIQLSHEINCWFALLPDRDAPVATPLLGRTTRHRHIKQLLASQGYSDAIATLGYHWGERFLNPVCPLHALIDPAQLSEQTLTPGSEPCTDLGKVYERNGEEKVTQVRHECPFSARCPSHQIYRDSVDAQVWVTTAGTMAQGSLPTQIEDRAVKIGDIVYERSDLVIFDEADTMIEWFDRTYAAQQTLVANGKGLLDKLDLEISEEWGYDRVQSTTANRWIEALRRFLTPATNIVALMNKHIALRLSVEQGYFTARGLLYGCARRMAGAKVFQQGEDEAELSADIAIIMDIFERLLRERDPLDMLISSIQPVTLPELRRLVTYKQMPDSPERAARFAEYEAQLQHATRGLIQVMQHVMLHGSTPTGRKHLREWIEQLIPDVKERISALRERLKTSENAHDQAYWRQGRIDDSPRTIAVRLELAINAVLLDRHSRLVLNRWDNRPNAIVKQDQPHSGMPRGLQNILPLPPIGRTFGIYHLPDLDEAANTLSTFGYTNIGRDYLLNFHQLRARLEQQAGPNVWVMSGTSYLPHSTRWHVGTPDGVIKRVGADKTLAIRKALQDETCWFAYRPMFDKAEKPIRISGNPDKESAMYALVDALVESDLLMNELSNLHALNDYHDDFWRDRQRLLLLVNSYEQCEWIGRRLREQLPALRSQIRYLVQEKADPDKGEFERVDIEQFAQHGGVILVAPLQAIGRGFNILNTTTRKAAFGAVFFLTRPMPHPHDVTAIAQEINRRDYDWKAHPDFIAWQLGDTVHASAVELRKEARSYWHEVEKRKFYRDLRDEEDGDADVWHNANPRRDLAATTAGRIVQAVGRLLRGDVPFHAYFVDAAWSPRQAIRVRDGEGKSDDQYSSLLVEIIHTLHQYIERDPFGRELYGYLHAKLEETENLW